MKYVDLNGDEGDVDVGQPVKNIGFQVVILTYEDACNPHFLMWFSANVFHRIVSPVPVSQIN